MKKLQEKPELVDDIRFGKHQFRRASLLPAHDLDLYPPTEPDCGKIGHRPHLSRVHAKDVTQQFKLGYYEAGERKPYPMSCSFGWHRWPNAKYEETDIGMLSEYGVGVAFYFKLVKALLVIFLLMNVCTLPSMIMYILGNYIQPVDLAYQKATSSQSFLGSSTVGSLGEPFPICFQVPENQAMTLKCPGNSIIRSVVAYYGQPSGSCTCPLPQQPSTGPTPRCKGKRSFTTSASIFSNKMTFQGQQCVPNEDGSIPQCFLGSTRFGVGCCSDSLDDSFHADLSSLNINPMDQCNSYTAQYMADIACKGRNSCTLPIKVCTLDTLANIS